MERENNQSIKKRLEFVEEIFAGYKGGEEMPLASYAALLGIYNAAFLALLLAAQNSEDGLPVFLHHAADAVKEKSK